MYDLQALAGLTPTRMIAVVVSVWTMICVLMIEDEDAVDQNESVEEMNATVFQLAHACIAEMLIGGRLDVNLPYIQKNKHLLRTEKERVKLLE
jgi:uncharacterized PurR-regulated membrane protein YhhQ (DUF165 family)